MMRFRPLRLPACLLVLACAMSASPLALPGAQDAPALPHRAEIIPGKLYAHVYAHEFPAGDETVRAWSFVSEGLERLGQHEIVFTLRRPRGTNWPDFTKDVFGIFDVVFEQAGKGSRIEAYNGMTFTANGTFLGLQGDLGLVFVPAEMFDGVEVPFQALAAVLVRGPDIEVMTRYSALRLASMLGAASRYYPCPPWSEIGRKPVVSAKHLGKSFIDKFERQGARGLSIRQTSMAGTSGRYLLGLRVEGSSLQGLNAMLAGRPVPDMFCLMTQPDPDVSMRFAWLPGQGGRGLIYADMGIWTTGSYVAFVVGDDLEEAVNQIEDGYVMVMSPATWSRLKASLASAKSDDIPIGDKALMRTEFVQTFAVDKLALPCYTPRFVGMVQPQAELEARLGDAAALKAFVETFTAATRSALAGAGKGDACGLLVAVGLKPGKRIRIWREAIEGTLPEETLKKLDEALARVPPVEVTGGPVAFVLKGPLWDRKVKAYPDLPSAWSGLKDAAGDPITTLDGIFRIAWPDEPPATELKRAPARPSPAPPR